METQLLIGHACHHLSQSSGITIEPIHAPKIVMAATNCANRSALFFLEDTNKSSRCRCLVPQNHRQGSETRTPSRTLNVRVSVNMLSSGAPKANADRYAVTVWLVTIKHNFLGDISILLDFILPGCLSDRKQL